MLFFVKSGRFGDLAAKGLKKRTKFQKSWYSHGRFCQKSLFL